MNKTVVQILISTITILFLSGCYTKLSEPVYREYYTEQDTIQAEEYSSEAAELSDYNQGYSDGYRDFLHEYLWSGYNSRSPFYTPYDPYWYSPWNYNYSFYLGFYDPFFYDPFWDWGYYGYYSPYSYYSYNSWYSPYYQYHHGYFYYRPWYYSGYRGYARRHSDSEGRKQLQADRTPASGVSYGTQANRNPSVHDSGFQNTLNLPMTASSGGGSSKVSNPIPDKKSTTDLTQKIKSSSSDISNLDVRTGKSADESIPGFQTKLLPPKRSIPTPTKPASAYITTDQKRTSSAPEKKVSQRSLPKSKNSANRSETKKNTAKPRSSSRSSNSDSSYKDTQSSGSSGTSRSSSVRRSSSSSSSSSRSSSSRSSSSSSRSSSSSSKSSSSKSSSSNSSKKNRD